MKNTLYFSKDLVPVLLENEENELNTIYLQINTSSATGQKCQINAKGITTTINLSSSATVNFELDGEKWAVGGDTAIRFMNDGATGEWYYITFPAIISTDAALQESEEERHYLMQGQDDEEAQEFASKLVVFKNKRDYYISTMQKIVELKYASSIENTQALFNLTINLTASGISDEADVILRIRVNRAFDDFFIPRQTLKNKKYIITVTYPVTTIALSDKNQLDVYMQMTDGTAYIPQGQLIGTMIGNGLIDSGAFTGEIEALDIVADFTVNEVSFEDAADSITISRNIPTGGSFTDMVSDLTVPEGSFGGNVNDGIRIIWHSTAAERISEEDGYIRALEDSEATGDPDIRYTEEEVT